jgi:hypothetical protein
VKQGPDLALLTDLYQLTMAQGYFQSGRLEPATFSLFIRAYPLNRGYFVAAGLKDVLDFSGFLSAAKRSTISIPPACSPPTFSTTVQLCFTGEVRALPEGRIFSRMSRYSEITAPIVEAQIAETFAINQIHLQSLIATKASRCVHAARGRSVVDFAAGRMESTRASRSRAQLPLPALPAPATFSPDRSTAFPWSARWPILSFRASSADRRAPRVREKLSGKLDFADRHLRHDVGRAQSGGSRARDGGARRKPAACASTAVTLAAPRARGTKNFRRSGIPRRENHRQRRPGRIRSGRVLRRWRALRDSYGLGTGWAFPPISRGWTWHTSSCSKTAGRC